MDFSEWKVNLLARTSGRAGDVTVSPSVDVKPDSFDQLLSRDKGDCSGLADPASPKATADALAFQNLVLAGGSARCR